MAQSRDCLSALVGELGIAERGLQTSPHKYWIGFSMWEKTPSSVSMCVWLWVCVFLCRGCVGISIPVLIDKCSATQKRLGLFSDGKDREVAGAYSSVKQLSSTHQLTCEGSIYKRFCIICSSAVSLLAGSREHYPEDQAAAVSGAAGFRPASPREKRPKGVPAVRWDPVLAGRFLCYIHQPALPASAWGRVYRAVALWPRWGFPMTKL